MSLPEDYLTYPSRAYGMDNPHYDWAPINNRPKVTLKDGMKVAVTIIVPVEFFPLNPPDAPFKHPGSVQTPYPDLRHFSSRDYGNRVGIYRLLRTFERFGIKATFAINAEIVNRYPPLIDAIRAGGHEIAAHGVSTAHIHHAGLSLADERALIAQTRAALPNATSWMSPARNESYNTLSLLSEAGFNICLDWEADQRPHALQTESGPIISLPHYSELSDFKLLLDSSQTEEDWVAQIAEAAHYQLGRYDQEGASVLAFTMTPYILGQPFRIKAVAELLAKLQDMEGLKTMTARDAVAAFASPA